MKILLSLILLSVSFSAGASIALAPNYDDFDDVVEQYIHRTFMFETVNPSDSQHQRYRALQHFRMLLGSFPQRDGAIVFPDFYGGAYVDGVGRLILLIAEAYAVEAANHPIVAYLIAARVSFRYRHVEFSYNQLHEAHNALSAAVRGSRAAKCPVAIHYLFSNIRLQENVIHIHLYGYTDELAAAFRADVFDAPMLQVVEGFIISWPIPEPTTISIMQYALAAAVTVSAAFVVCLLIKKFSKKSSG